MAVVLVAVALGGSGGTGSVRTPPASHGTVPRPDHSVVTPVPVPTGPDERVVTGGSTGGDVLGGTSDGADPSSAGGDPAGSAGSTPVPTTTTPAPPAPEQQSYSSNGGSITVRFADGQVSLVTDSPAAGFTAEVHDNGPTRVEVRFSDGQTEWRIRVEVVDGQLVPEITQH